MPISNRLVVSQEDFRFFVEKNHVIYCQSDNNYTSIYLTHGRNLLIGKSLVKKIKDNLDSIQFIRISQSLLVNKNFIKLIGKKNKCVEMPNEHKVPFKIIFKILLQLISIYCYISIGFDFQFFT